MTRLRPLDRVLLATLVPLWALCFLFLAHAVVREKPIPSVLIKQAASPNDYPVVTDFWEFMPGRQSGLEIGDKLIELGNADLRGAGRVEAAGQVTAHVDAAYRVRVLFERHGERRHTILTVGSHRMHWPFIPISFAFAFLAVLLLLRAPAGPLVRSFYLGFMGFALFFGSFFGHSKLTLYAHLGGMLLGGALMTVFTVRGSLLFPHGQTSVNRWVRALPWLFLPFGVVQVNRLWGLLPFHRLSSAVFFAYCAAFMVVMVAAFTANYRRVGPIGRRQIRWVIFGAYCSFAPLTVGVLLTIVDPSFALLVNVLTLGLVVWPLCFLIAILRDNLFDIDRLISATTSYSILLAIFLAGGLLIVPHVATAAAGWAGLDPTVVESILAIVIALLAVPGARWIGPFVDRLFFRERGSLLEGIDSLLVEISRAERLDDLAIRTGERLNELLSPISCAIYARRENSFDPIFVRGRTVPDVLPVDGPLGKVLAAKQRPIELETLRKPASGIGLTESEDRVLARSHTRVLLPIHRKKEVVAFVTLGEKRSGDIYTQTDLALLGAVADKVSTVLTGFDETKLASIGESMARIMHDLKNPLFVAMGYTELLANAKNDEEREEMSRLVLKQFDLMQHMASDVVSFARGESNILASKVHVNHFLNTLRDQLEPELRKQNVSLEIDAGYRGVAYFDELQLVRAISNLARNAVEAMPDGGTLRVATHNGSGQFVIECSDDGPGISPELEGRLFTPFATAGKDGGTGLGLLSVKRIVDEHQGTISVTSSPGTGTTFTIELPLPAPEQSS